jgi:hypothetical protein
MKRTLRIGSLVVLGVVLGWFALAALGGRYDVHSVTGKVVSVTTVSTGKVVCVVDAGGKRECGEVSRPDRPSVEVGECAYIRVTRGAAIKLKLRPCSR